MLYDEVEYMCLASE